MVIVNVFRKDILISYLAQKYFSWLYFCCFSQVCNILWLLVHGWLIAIAGQWAEPICPQDLPTSPPHKAHNTQNTHTTQNTRDDVQNTLPIKPFAHNSVDESGLMNRMNPAYFHKILQLAIIIICNIFKLSSISSHLFQIIWNSYKKYETIIWTRCFLSSSLIPFLAVQDSSKGDLVTHSLSEWVSQVLIFRH